MDERVCRDINVDIRDKSRWGNGGIVSLEDAPRERTQVTSFLGTVLPGRKVLKVGRESMLQICGYRQMPTSLFFQAVHKCFEGHHGLVLRPEVLMHLIVNEVATTVNLHPEEYRHLFTKEAEGRVRIDTEVTPWDENGWRDNLEEYGQKLAELVPAGIMEHLLPDFSTATPESRAASMVAFMSAAREYYDYHSHTRCGIPRVVLMGTDEDYYKILHAAVSLSERFPHLDRYFTHLLPVLKTIATQAAGEELDNRFWSSIYKFESESGMNRFNGWLTAFVNYVQTAPTRALSNRPAAPGGLVAKPDDACDWENCGRGWGMKGLDLGSVPSHVSTAPFTWHHLDGTESKMLFAGGVLAVDEFQGAIMPVLSYAVLEDSENK